MPINAIAPGNGCRTHNGSATSPMSTCSSIPMRCPNGVPSHKKYARGSGPPRQPRRAASKRSWNMSRRAAVSACCPNRRPPTINAPMSSEPRSPTSRRSPARVGGDTPHPAYRGVRGARRGCGEGCDARSVDVIGTQRRYRSLSAPRRWSPDRPVARGGERSQRPRHLCRARLGPVRGPTLATTL